MRQLGQLFEGGTVAGLNDRQLLERFVGRRDEVAFAAIVERHGPMVLGVCRAVLKDAAEVEDAFQATFLVLVRKAGSVRGVDTLGGWLHRVAYRIAVQAAADIARRRTLEHRAGELAAMKTDIAEFPDDLRALLHEEIDRLPENFRLAIVLCDLDGLSQPDAARQLGWTDGALRGRLSRARAKLHDRLTKRGLAITAGLLVEALAKESSATVPRVWINAIAKAAVAMPAGKIVATGAISATAAKLAQTTLATLFAESAKGVATVGALLVALGLVGVHTVPVGFAQSGNDGEMKREMPASKQAAPSIKPLVSKAEEERTKPVTFAGVVLDPDGKPFAGAKIYLTGYALKNTSSVFVRAASGKDGKFQFDVPIDQFDRTFHAEPWSYAPVLARAEGFAFGLANFEEGKALIVQLVRDLPIEGRVIDIQGKPVPGVSVQVNSIMATEDEDLTAWLKAVQEKQALYVDGVSTLLTRQLQAQPKPPLIPPARTDADGRFRITGIGRERLAELHIEAPTIETARVMARTRPGEVLRFPPWSNTDDRITILGSSFVHVAGPTRPIEGTVTDRDTGKPLADITVMGERSLSAGSSESASARTDKQGHYRLVGLPRGREGDIVALAPADLPFYGRRRAEQGYPPEESLPYVQAQIAVPKQNDQGTITLDIGLKRGTYVTGRVLDKSTDKPVEARVEYYVPFGNPVRKEFTGSRLSSFHQFHPTDRSGKFGLIAYPGPGILGIRAQEDKYVFSVGIEALAKWKDKEGFIVCEPASLHPLNHHSIVEIDPAKGTSIISKDLFVDPGRVVTVDLVGPDGKPAMGDQIAGRIGIVHWEKPSVIGPGFRIEGLIPGKVREVAARNDAKRLVGTLLLKGNETSPVRMTLQPWGEITGRLIDADGQPWSKGIEIHDFRKDLTRANVVCPEPGSDGQFRIVGLIPGRTYNFLVGDKKTHFLKGRIIADVTLKPGEVKDVGDVTPKPWQPK
jgi:RNA polymerase sigma factor (sigma-70 family)